MKVIRGDSIQSFCDNRATKRKVLISFSRTERTTLEKPSKEDILQLPLVRNIITASVVRHDRPARQMIFSFYDRTRLER